MEAIGIIFKYNLIGKKIPEYTRDIDLNNYLKKNIKGDIFNAYTSFFIHVDNLCYYLQNKVWTDSASLTANSVESELEELKYNMYFNYYLVKML